jgi:hypothetical protein
VKAFEWTLGAIGAASQQLEDAVEIPLPPLAGRVRQRHSTRNGRTNPGKGSQPKPQPHSPKKCFPQQIALVGNDTNYTVLPVMPVADLIFPAIHRSCNGARPAPVGASWSGAMRRTPVAPVQQREEPVLGDHRAVAKSPAAEAFLVANAGSLHTRKLILPLTTVHRCQPGRKSSYELGYAATASISPFRATSLGSCRVCLVPSFFQDDDRSPGQVAVLLRAQHVGPCVDDDAALPQPRQP